MKFLLVLLFSVSALARITDDQVEIKVSKDEIIMSPKAGFHLNAEAPATATFDNLEAAFKPEIKTEKKFSFKKSEKFKTATLSFYVCDDKKTVCEQHKETINLKTGNVKKADIKANYNEMKDFNLASTNGKPTLLVFSAPWCPACIRMQTETYHTPKVEKQFSKINFVKLNSDLAENYDLSEKFKVKAIPTLILLDKNGQEAYRWLDFQKADGFAKSLQTQLAKIDQASALLKNAQLGDVKASSELAYRAFNTLDYEEAVKWFSLAKSERDIKFKLSSEISLAREKADEDEKLNEEYFQTAQKAIVLTTSELDRIRWTLDLFEKKKELNVYTVEARAKTKELVKSVENLLSKPKLAAQAFKQSTYGDYDGFETEELLWLKGHLHALLDEKNEQDNNNKRTIALINKKNLSVKRPGEMLMAISYLREAGEVKKVDELYKQLVQTYPDSYVYFEKYARFVQKNKDLEKELALSNEALKFPEGNERQLNLLKSQLLKDLNKKSEALAVIDTTLKANNIQHKRYVRTVKKLNELKGELVKAN